MHIRRTRLVFRLCFAIQVAGLVGTVCYRFIAGRWPAADLAPIAASTLVLLSLPVLVSLLEFERRHDTGDTRLAGP